MNVGGKFMKESKIWKTMQIIPAQDGWKAVHCQGSENGQVRIFNRSIICWALVEAMGESEARRTEVRGMEQDSNHFVVVEDAIHLDEPGDDGIGRNQYFLGYDDPHAHEESEYWVRQAKARLQAEKEKRA